MIQLVSRAGKFKRQLDENQKAALELTGELLKKYMDNDTPVDTGVLKSNNMAEIIRNELTLYNNTPYAKFVEFGTYKMRAQPFMRPAALNHTREIKEIWEMSLNKGMD
jgi:HK97 gp10 family phage protein